MKTTLKAFTLVAGSLFAGSALATTLVCDVYPKSGGNSFGNGTKNCGAFDYSFGNSTSGKFYLINISKPIQEVRWEGRATCSGGTSCNATIRAYTQNKASALILYKDGTWEQANTASAWYETGH
ncbi:MULTISPECIES: hypothetical protein [Pseudoalteromonas]|uniref:Uncharacterized protein n=1 Tax=Pseudoalteromonas amylolytica TaxID=1859457 RepID=A0A1S1MTE0_9GAMM|nr:MULTISPECIES: hypothetical protein [Pseudoalteromonas]MCF6436669.1 hypothetical protein [Pseudoalteromonas sp. MMG022]OHU84285.1 hypothetical protein BFC16_01160 [Pseudoalteromonas sp. JW3]OHU87176.1 hypothetical protein BET10_00780 [Pseudoalteromonas amylolytica]